MGSPTKEVADPEEVKLSVGEKKKMKWVKSFFFLLSPSFLYFVTCVVIPGLEHPFITESHTG